MNIIKNTLRPVIEPSEDPGVYPSGAGEGPLPTSYGLDRVDGELVADLTDEEIHDIWVAADMHAKTYRMVETWVNEDARSIPHGIAGLDVQAWTVNALAGFRVTLAVDRAEADDCCIEAYRT